MNYILYALYLPNLTDENSHNQQIFSQFYYSLETLKQTGYNGKVVVYYDSNIDLSKFYYLNNYNAVRDFDFVFFTKFKYDSYLKILTPASFQKWQSLKIFNRSYDYDSVLYVDNDTFFNRNPKELFEKYKEENIFYSKQYDKTKNLFYEKINLATASINSGQFLLNKKIIDKLDQQNLFLQNITKEYFKILISTMEYKPKMVPQMYWIGEEYAVTKILESYVIPIKQFDDIDCKFGTVDRTTVFSHYYSANTKNAIPEKYWSNYTKNNSNSSYSFTSTK